MNWKYRIQKTGIKSVTITLEAPFYTWETPPQELWNRVRSETDIVGKRPVGEVSIGIFADKAKAS